MFHLIFLLSCRSPGAWKSPGFAKKMAKLRCETEMENTDANLFAK